MRAFAAFIFASSCAAPASPVTVDPDEASDSGGKGDGGSAVPDVRCDGAPAAGVAGAFRHWKNKLIAIESPRHRGFDLVTNAGAASQSIEGWLSYGPVDKALEDEDVDVFACRAGSWQAIGRTRTDGEGHFQLALAGSARLPVGMRDLYASVVGDRTGIPFLGYVAEDQALIVSDVDGTLTSSENAFFATLTLGIEPDAQANAAAAYRHATAAGYQLVYVTARGNQSTQATRDWLDHQGFPRGPVRLAPHFITLPGNDTIDYKTSTIEALAAELPIAAGVGNRASDITAYANVGIDPASRFIKLPEFAGEVGDAIAAGEAIGLDDYAAFPF